jgi:hypothetical protein
VDEPMIARAWYVMCDQCGSPAEIATDGAQQAKEYARAQGFKMLRRDGSEHWLCPWGCRQAEESAAALLPSYGQKERDWR